jgi:putative N6-adenine-specific DNA methylase
MRERFFAPCPRGLETPLADELTALDAVAVGPADGGVAFEGPIEIAYRANLESRIASRVLWRVGGGCYRDERDVHELARAVDWKRSFGPGCTIRVDVAATRSPLPSLEFATLTVKDAVCDRLRADTGSRPSVDKRAPDVRVHVHLTADAATFYLDTSGEPLFKRGYRRDTEEAPLRENLAAGLLALAGWRTVEPLLDPMCGSGTIAIEAALRAANRAPGLARAFGFQKLAWYDGPTWQRIRQKAHDRLKSPPAMPVVFASDLEAGAVAKCAANAKAAKVEAFLAIERADVLDRVAPAPAGTLVSNPPYGTRLSERERLAAFYPRLGDALKRHFAGWTAWLLSGDPGLAKRIGLRVARRIPLYNGAIECRLYGIPLVAGRHGPRAASDGPSRDGPAEERPGSAC